MKTEKIIINSKIDFLLIKFPIIFPLIYAFVLYAFPKFENLLILLTLILLAETHFGATWPFFLGKANHENIIKEKVIYIAIPLLIIVYSLFGFFYFNSFYLLLFFAVNVFHVARQSYGICNIYSDNKQETKFQELLIYFYNSAFFAVAIFRWYIPIITGEDNILLLNLVAITSITFVSIFYILKFGFSNNFLTFLTGIILFYPMCFAAKPIHGILMGAGMHYAQYIVLTYKVTSERKMENKSLKESGFNGYSNASFFLIIISYGLIMGLMSLTKGLEDQMLKNLIIIPLIGQLLHFYLDAVLWRFRDSHNRKVTLRHLFPSSLEKTYHK